LAGLSGETARDAERKKRLAAYRARFIEGPVLVLRFGEKASYSFEAMRTQARLPDTQVTDDGNT
jgi:hypothetical protein